MPIPTPFHPRTADLCTSLFWKDWAGCHAVRSYDTSHDREYLAIRHSAALIDVSPLFKYEVRGPQAADLLSFVTVKDVKKMRPGRVSYLCWCDDDGKVVDDGTVSCLGPQHYRVTAAEPALAWLGDRGRRFDATIEDVTRRLGALALQGPTSRDLLQQVCADDVFSLRFFRVMGTTIAGVDVHVSRTGYTGDLGFEIWARSEEALRVWDALVEAGKPFLLEPTGLDALDVARIEAGFVMNGVDYFSANHCLLESRKTSPWEIGLGWTVQLERDPFLGQAALRRERERGPARALAGLVLDWDEYEALFEQAGLPPAAPPGAWRTPVPVHDRAGRQVGRATSGAWSPLLKQNLALASLEAASAVPGTRVALEVTVEFRRHRVTATVTPTPFFDPPRKRA
jgi:aminomethyltransferase